MRCQHFWWDEKRTYIISPEHSNVKKIIISHVFQFKHRWNVLPVLTRRVLYAPTKATSNQLIISADCINIRLTPCQPIIFVEH